MIRSNTKQVLRFCIGGLCASASHILIFVALLFRLSADVGLANAIAFFLTTVGSYLATTYWTFEMRHSEVVAVRFAIVASLGGVLSGIIATLIERAGLPWWQGVVAILCTLPVLTLVAHRNWTYRG